MVGAVRNIIGRGDQRAQDGLFAHNPGIGENIGRTRRGICQHADVRQPAGLFRHPLFFQPLGCGNHIDRVTVREQFLNRVEDQLVILAIEITLPDLAGDVIPFAVIQQQAAEQRLLRFKRLGWLLSSDRASVGSSGQIGGTNGSASVASVRGASNGQWS